MLRRRCWCFRSCSFPAGDPASATLASLATFGIAFLARPIGSALFGHFGDRIGRKRTLVVAAGDHGHLDSFDWCAAYIPFNRVCRAAAAGAVPVWARDRAGPVSGAARCCWRLRTRPRISRALVWDVSAVGRASRLFPFRRSVPGALAFAHRPAILRIRRRLPFLASACWYFWPVCTAHHYRDACI